MTDTDTIKLNLPDDVKDKFIAADTAFLTAMKAQGHDMLSAVQLLAALHATASEEMSQRLNELVMDLLKGDAEKEA